MTNFSDLLLRKKLTKARAQKAAMSTMSSACARTSSAKVGSSSSSSSPKSQVGAAAGGLADSVSGAGGAGCET